MHAAYLKLESCRAEPLPVTQQQNKKKTPVLTYIVYCILPPSFEEDGRKFDL